MADDDLTVAEFNNMTDAEYRQRFFDALAADVDNGHTSPEAAERARANFDRSAAQHAAEEVSAAALRVGRGQSDTPS